MGFIFPTVTHSGKKIGNITTKLLYLPVVGNQLRHFQFHKYQIEKMKKIILLIIAIVSTGFLKAQDISAFNLTFNHLALLVKDVERSAEFYKNVLTLKEITNQAKATDMRWLSLGENMELHLISIGDKNIVIDTAIHFAFKTQNFDAFINRMDKIKIPYVDTDGKPHTFNVRADGVKQIYFQDPDGYWIEVNNIRQK